MDVRPTPSGREPDRCRWCRCGSTFVLVSLVTSKATRATAFRVLPPRWAAATWYSGPESRLAEAVAQAYNASGDIAGFTVIGLPLEEHYTTSHIMTGTRIETLRLLLPISPTRTTG